MPLNLFKSVFWALLLLGPVACAQPAATVTPVIVLPRGSGITNANAPRGGLIQASDGNLYGTTWMGGTYDQGTVFKLTLDGVLTTLHSFNGNDGGSPETPVVEGQDGYLYGVTPVGTGPAYWGAIFKAGKDGSFTNLFFFPDRDAYPGNPYGYGPTGLILGSDGDLYGTTELSSRGSSGTLFQITEDGSITPLWTSTGFSPRGLGVLTEGSNGNLYGVIPRAGAIPGAGCIYTMPRATGTATILAYFSASGGTNGIEPNSILQAADGCFYGVATSGGPWPHETNATYFGYGTVFKMTPNGVLSLLHAFNGADGAYPVNLIQASDGNFYGTTGSGGTNQGGGGTLFQISPSGEFKSLYSFSAYDQLGYLPICSLVQASDGAFYGTTWRGPYVAPYGGSFGGGAIFRLTVPSADSPRIESVNMTADGVTLKWLALKRRSYQVQYCSDLMSSIWSNLAGPIVATQNMVIASDPNPPVGQRYYRVALLP